MNGTFKQLFILFQRDHITQLDLDAVERGCQDAESAMEFFKTKGTIMMGIQIKRPPNAPEQVFRLPILKMMITKAS